jgi:hypothetical protein
VRRRWLHRLTLLALVLAVLDVGAVVLDFEPDHLRLVLLVCLAFAAGVLFVDTLSDTHRAWADDPPRSGSASATDLGLAGYVRLIESHLTAATPDAAMRDRLALLCDERLARKHSLTREDPGAGALLGADLLEALAGPVRRLRRDEIDHYLERIEKL